MQEIIVSQPVQRGEAVKFAFKEDGIPREGILALLEQGNWKAYENSCRHIPLPLDYGDGKFFDPTGQWLTCQTHGAIYDPATGHCLEGPCRGARLRELEIEEIDQRLFLKEIK